jgi:hypothetical protein
MYACEVKLVPPDVQLPLLRSSIIAETVEQTIEKLYRLEIRLSESHKRCFYMDKEPVAKDLYDRLKQITFQRYVSTNYIVNPSESYERWQQSQPESFKN